MYLLDTNHCSALIFGDSILIDLGIGENDLWIAATAIENNLIVVSCDRDFQKIQQAWDFPLENWHNLFIRITII